MAGLITYVTYFYYKYFTRENPLPGPVPLPFVGNSIFYFIDLIDAVSKLQAKYGDFFEFYMGGERHICLLNEDLVKEMTKPTLNGNFFRRGNGNGGTKELGHDNFGIGLNENYYKWRYNRKFFSKTILSPLFCRQALTCVQAGFEEMSGYWDLLGEEAIINFPEWIKRYFMETLTIIISNKPLHALSNFHKKLSNKEISRESAESEELVDTIRFINEILHWFVFMPAYTSGNRSNTQNQPLVPDMLTMFLTVNTPRDITERIADDQNDKPMTDEEVVGNYFDVLIGGVDNGANAMCFLVYYLTQYPKVKRRLLKEIDTVVGRNSNIKITMNIINKLEYTEAYIKEDPVEIGGVTFPSNTIFFSSSFALHTHKSHWSNPEEFNPDRFLRSSPESKNPFYMFGSGERKCPGRNLAMLELKASLLMLYLKYDVELVAPIKFSGKAVRNCTELKLRIKKRRDLSLVDC
ncbi:3032_t:CDS:2 [Acaulospora colombiana]|uniref:3032_t:CDS:1 n=1 Tax=Acaulospora colombiana TaxID=27376 RepID=A0ACA9LHN9_9GLOM|nr:3032_t:CDS:2 [Acaulospora colombiana]